MKRQLFQPILLFYLHRGAFLWTLLAALLFLPGVAYAQDKSGVKPQVISLPSGPGSLEGLGETFEPNLSTGTSSYPVKFIAAPGRIGFQPEIVLNYNGGNANGPWGIGWKLSIPAIQRRTEDGLPTYDDSQDQFIYSNGEKLVALNDGSYRFENESSFMRFRRIDGGGWEAHTPDGIRYLFGETPNSRVMTEKGSFRWELERVIDTHGNEMQYSYLHDGGYAYPREIRYNFGANGLYNTVIFNYEPRPDTYTDRRSGSPIRVGLRGTDIQMWAIGKLVRAYQFTYEPERSTGKYSLLIKVEQVGDDGVSKLPPHTFTYTQFDTTAHEVVTMQNPPPVALTNPDADLVDINADGLPDIVYTPAAGGHRFYLNRGQGRWQVEPVLPQNSPAERLSNPNVRMADMDGDGRVDLLVKASATGGTPLYYYANNGDGEWQLTDRVDFGPAPAFDLNDPNAQLIDVNNDHRIDVVLTGGGRMKIWLAREGAWSQTADFDVPAPAAGDAASFADPKIKVGDMTGDRMEDLVFVRDGQVILWAHNGNGSYDVGEAVLNPPTGVGAQAAAIQVGDLNNDGLVDLVLPGNRVVYYWLSLGDGSLTEPIILNNTPEFNAQTVAVRLADIDGDGATELLFSSQTGMHYVDFSIGSQPFLLQSVDNGLGRTILIDYKSSIADYIADWDAGTPWQVNLPFPVQVVRQVNVHDANSGDDYIIDYHYRDGYYDGVQKEFRGFVRSQEIKRGDASAATTVTNLVYDVGMNDEARKGMLIESEILGEGGACNGSYTGCYQRKVNQLTTRVVVDAGQTATGKPIAYAYVSQSDTYLHEQGAEPVHLRQLVEQDAYGNRTQEFNYGQVCGPLDQPDVTCGNDEVLVYTEYIYDASRYIFNRPQRTHKTDATGALVSDTRFYYDGEPFVGLPLGQLTRGDLTREESWLGPQEARFVQTKRQQFDAYGNVIGLMDANGNLTAVDYDPLLYTFPTVERLHLGNGRSLTYAASYHYGFGKMMTATDYNGHPYTFAYDPFGRIVKIVRPGDTLQRPTQTFRYEIGSPRSAIWTEQRERSGTDETLISVTYFDGLGRKLQTRSEAENGQVIVTDAVVYNARQGVREQLLPYAASGFAYQAPDPAFPRTTQYFDPLERVIKTINPDGAFASTVYQPLVEIFYDEEDNNPSSPHANTPKTQRKDGLGRLIAVEEINIVNGVAAEYTTRYRYDTLGNLTQIVDATGAIKTMHYDALGRKLQMDDPNAGLHTYRYDDNGNLRYRRDANGVEVEYTYDAANRLLSERWPTANPATYAIYHYDADLAPQHTDAANTLGRMSWIEDQAGAIYFSYDARGNTTSTIRQFKDEGLSFVTHTDYDALDRPWRLTYPDGFTLNYVYDSRGLLARIPGFVENIGYTASGLRQSMHLANGAVRTYQYDARQRLIHLQTLVAQTALQELTYGLDGASNVVDIQDGRATKSISTDLTQHFTYDALYRLVNASGAYGQIAYRYDAVGNLVSKVSSDPGQNLGDLRYGEVEPAGPYAVTAAGGLRYTYDHNGNLTAKITTSDQQPLLLLTYDPRNQLTAVEDRASGASYAYRYDTDGQRTHALVQQNGVLTRTLYVGANVEVRGNQLIYHIFDDKLRVAQVSRPFDPARLLAGFARPSTPPSMESICAQPATTCTWIITDHLGGASLTLDATGGVVAELTYYPYGQTRHAQNSGQVYYGFTGKELDATGLHYFGARYYDAGLGRFLSVDPLYIAEPQRGLENPQLLNLYAYVLNSPLRFVDPDGADPKVPLSVPQQLHAGSSILFQPISTAMNLHKALDSKRSAPDRIAAGMGAAGAVVGKYAAAAKLMGSTATATTLSWVAAPATSFALGYAAGRAADDALGISDAISDKLARKTLDITKYPTTTYWDYVGKGKEIPKETMKAIAYGWHQQGRTAAPTLDEAPRWVREAVARRESAAAQANRSGVGQTPTTQSGVQGR